MIPYSIYFRNRQDDYTYIVYYVIYICTYVIYIYPYIYIYGYIYMCVFDRGNILCLDMFGMRSSAFTKNLARVLILYLSPLVAD